MAKSLQEKLSKAITASESDTEMTPAPQVINQIPTVPIIEEKNKEVKPVQPLFGIQTPITNINKTPIMKEPSKIGMQLTSDLIERVININEEYKKMDRAIQQTLLNYLNLDSEVKESSIIHAIITINPDDVKPLIDVVNLRSLEDRERIFTLFEFEDSRLLKIIKFLAALMPNLTSSNPQNKIEYCRTIEQYLDHLDPTVFANLAPMAKIFTR